MNVQRVGLRALRQVAAKPNALPRLAMAGVQTRGASTQKMSIADSHENLASQRKQRPVAPHITIYDYNQIWLGASIWTRFTGMAFGGGLYAFAIAYLASPMTGMHLESATLAAGFAAWPAAVKVGVKFLTAWPFVFHFMAGVRHIVFDFAKGFSKKQISTSAWGIWGASLGASIALAFGF